MYIRIIALGTGRSESRRRNRERICLIISALHQFKLRKQNLGVRDINIVLQLLAQAQACLQALPRFHEVWLRFIKVSSPETSEAMGEINLRTHPLLKRRLLFRSALAASNV